MTPWQVAVLASGVFWTVAYAAIVYRGFKDRSYGMPVVALALNLTWEITFTFVFPGDRITMASIIKCLWMLLDVGIVVTYFRFGYRHFRDSIGVSRSVWFGGTVLAFALSMLIMVTGGTFFGGLQDYFAGDIGEGGRFIAYQQNAIMSILFVSFFYARRAQGEPIAGQSFWVAATKFAGTSLTVGPAYLLVHSDNWYFMGSMVLVCFIFDVWYAVLIWRELSAQGINPLVRL